MTATPTRFHGWLLYPIINDDTGAVDYWDIHPPCPSAHTITRADGSTDRLDFCDDCHLNEPDAQAVTLTEARNHVRANRRVWNIDQQLDQLIGGR